MYCFFVSIEFCLYNGKAVIQITTMSRHGGSRAGSGRKPKYVDYKGNPLPTKQIRVPEFITEADIQDLVYQKTKGSDDDEDLEDDTENIENH